MDERTDVLVVGAGHAGCEAALAAARLGLDVTLLTLSLDTVAKMPCNPAIGGLAKGQLVREVDALGGAMARVTDRTGIQFRMLNTGKGPAVRALRAQCDKHLYALEMKRVVLRQSRLRLREESAETLEQGDEEWIVGARSGTRYRARVCILTTGTFLNGLLHTGDSQVPGGRAGEAPAVSLSDSLRRLGLTLVRLKTGTPPRLRRDSIDFDRTVRQDGDPEPRPFSFSTARLEVEQLPCFLTRTTERTHEIIRANLHRAPLYTGQITGTGPRYCPSIEDKIVRFAGRDGHQVFLEPEGRHTDEIYCNGISTSIPRDAQEEMVRSIPALERAEIVRYGYAVEYDFAPPTQLRPNLEAKDLPGLFLAGQLNGTSGYEEAAAQGLMAGINAALRLRREPPFVLARSEALIGVLIDDLTTRGTLEPYRMFTSRAEHRLLLRHGNADLRLSHHGARLGLVPPEALERVEARRRAIAGAVDRLERSIVDRVSLAQRLRRPGTALADLAALPGGEGLDALPLDVREEVEVEVKYAGYLERERLEVERLRRMEETPIPADVDYRAFSHLSNEGREKLARFRPATVGQASRVPGVSPADVSLLIVHLRRRGGAAVAG